jgi:putative hydrolase of the HAD superfamily
MKLYIFDMGGVVVYNAAIIPAMAASLGISEDDFFRGAGSDPAVTYTSPYHLGDVASLMRGEISSEQFWERFQKNTGCAAQGNPWYDYFHPVLNTGTLHIIAELHSAGCRVVCGTNSLDAHYQRHIERNDYKCFDRVYASHLMGIIKPAPEFWQRILEEEKARPEETFFVDDLEENIVAARKLGITAHRFTGAEGLAAALKV